MAYYGVLFPEFWTGRTGRDIRREGGANAQVLALYLMSNRHANMIGLYKVAVDDIVHETGLKSKAVVAALEVLARVDFARYDQASEFVWVLSMARFRLGLRAGEALQPGDRKVVAINKLYHGIDANPFLGEFFTANQDTLRINKARTPQRRSTDTTTCRPFDGASDGASEPLRCQVQDQRSGTRDQEQVPGDQEQEKARLAPPVPSPEPQPTDNLSVITRIAREIRQTHPSDGFADIKALTSEFCATKGIAYNSEVVGKAVDCAFSKRLAHAH